MSETKTESPAAVAGQVDCQVRPRAWAWKDEPSGIEVYSGWDEPRPTNGSEPLYDRAALDAEVAAERERWEAVVFDGWRVLKGLDEAAAKRTTHQNVSDTLDALMRVLRA